MLPSRTTPASEIARLVVGFGIVAAIVLFGGALSLWQLAGQYATVDTLARESVPNIVALSDIEDATEIYRNNELEHIIESDPRKMLALDDSRVRQAAEVERLLRHYARIRGADAAGAKEMDALWATYLMETTPFVEASRQNDIRAAADVLNGQARSTFSSLRALVDRLSLEEADVAGIALVEAESSFALARPLGFGLTVVGTLVVLLVGVSVVVLASRSARRISTSIDRLAVGEREAATLNQFTELAALTDDDAAATAATLATLDELVSADDSMLHISNRSQDRAVPEAALGEHTAEVVSLHELGRCPALRRSALYITRDVTARLSFRCPVYPVETGTVACVPLIALGEPVGVAHLHWNTPRELPLSSRTAITRVTEHAALSIANRRLLLALRSQAGTDARTGLANSRAFDEALELNLANRRGDDKLAVLMLDLDHFKDFNDAHGHPAGDEALRVFGEVLRSCVRDGDVAARYGGEEFAVMLPDLSATAAHEIAERIRERTESSSIALAPGKTGRLTVSIGIATVPDDATQRVSLLRLADEALYRAKTAGRNRVVASRRAASLAVVSAGTAAV